MSAIGPHGSRGGLVRPRRGRMVGGVCAALARRFGVSRFVVRLLFVASMLLPGPQILVYLGLWIITPNERELGP